MQPILNEGRYVFAVQPPKTKTPDHVIGLFREKEGNTLILKKEDADRLNLAYEFIAAWITLQVHSSLEAVGLTAIFASELARFDIGCNVVAGYYHDHIFVDYKDGEKAIKVLTELSEDYRNRT